MSITTEETLTANGVVLNTLAYNVSSLTGRLRVPVRRAANVTVPARHGALRTPRKPYEQGEITLPMWVVGADEDGLVPDSGPLRELLFTNVDMLSRVFGADTVELVHTLPDGSQRRALAETADVIDFAMTGGSRAEFSVVLTVAGAFWEDVIPVSQSFSGQGTWQLTEFVGATAPMDDLTIRFNGPAPNPRITSGSVWVQYSASLTAGQSVILNCVDWSLAGVGISPSQAAVSHGGAARWFELAPGETNPVAEVSQTGSGTMSTVLSGRRKYFVG